MKYTTSKLADKKIEQDLEIIKSTILKKIKPISILLFGGFGRGEGSFIIKNKKPIPLNDYDMYIVAHKKLSDKFLEKLSLECSKAINRGGLEFVEHPNEEYDIDKFFHVDIRCLTYKQLSKLLPTQRTAELKKSKIIYGKDILPLIPEVKVPVSDAIRLLFNKADHLLLAQENEKTIRIIYSSKTFLDCCTALLIFENKFDPTYLGRLKIFKKQKFPKELLKKVEWATNFKLNPNFNAVKNEDELFEEAKDWLEYTFKYIITKHLNLSSDDWNIIASALYNKLPKIYFKPYLKHNSLYFLQYYLTLKYSLKALKQKQLIIKPLFSYKDIGIKLAIPLILYLYNEKGLSEKYLKKITSKTQPLKDRILYLYSIYYLQKII